MYYTDLSTESYYSDCLYFYRSYMERSDSWELFPYCTRHENERQSECFHGQSISYGQLKEKQISSITLISWNIPIEVIDTYLSSYAASNDEFICNCTDQYFGPRCEYSYDYPVEAEFKNLVYRQLSSRTKMTYSQVNSTNVTCYQGLISQICNQTVICLDWRQICDGVIDCANGIDENECLSLESNQCDDQTNEYRCMDGRCIARNFLFDKQFDCMDKTDESENVYLLEHDCLWEPSIVCEELWHPQRYEYQCGDGGVPQMETCGNNRDAIYYRNLFQYPGDESTRLTPSCWIYLLCISGMQDLFGYNSSFCADLMNIKLDSYHEMYALPTTRKYFKTFCPSNVYITFPPRPIVSTFVYLVYIENSFTDSIAKQYWTYPDYVCFDYNVCSYVFPSSLHSTMIRINNLTCLFTRDLMNENRVPKGEKLKSFYRYIRQLFSSCTNYLNIQNDIQNLFYCPISKRYISTYRTLDFKADCFFLEDRKIDDTCALNLTDVFQCVNEPTRCLTRYLVAWEGCNYLSNELYPGICNLPSDFGCRFLRGNSLPPVYFIFQEICNGNTKMEYEIDGETDETNCNEWISTFNLQNNLCDGIWDNENGSDELDCENTIVYDISKQCSIHEHYCAHQNKSELGCLPVEKAGDGIIDCLGASDERHVYCKSGSKHYKCLSDTQCIAITYLCDGKQDCPMNDDEELCPWLANIKIANNNMFVCQNGMRLDRIGQRCDSIIDCPHGEDEWLCDLIRTQTSVPFSFHIRIGNYPPIDISSPSSVSTSTLSSSTMKSITTSTSIINSTWYCHRGIAIHYLDAVVRCLCPPAYYGRMCEYQSDRVTVFLRLIVPSSLARRENTVNQLPSLIKILIQLMVYETTVYHEQLSDVPGHRHIFYLLLPMNSTKVERKNTFIRINTFRITSRNIEHLTAAKYYLPFPFLPVNRLSLELLLLTNRACQQTPCGTHGHCKVYLNSNESYCVCDLNWMGPYCNISTTDCHRDAKCIQSTDTNHICVCPLGRFGSRCFASFNPCRVDSCSSRGQCYPTDQRTTKYACQCHSGYFGEKCEFQEAKLQVSFELQEEIQAGIIIFADLHSSQTGLLFINHRVLLSSVHMYDQMVISNENEAAVSRFVLLDTFGVDMSDHHLYVLVTLSTLAPLAKVKYYARLCWYNPQVKCFYDDAYLCFCDIVSAPDCLVFIQEPTICDKLSTNPCAHGGRCIQISSEKIWDFTCACPKCTYGALCQLSIEKYTLSFDVLFGRQIRPGPCMIFIGLIFNSLSFIIFIQPRARTVGVGFYLLILTILNQSGLFLFGAKFLLVLLTHLSNSSSMSHQALFRSCATIEYLLSIVFSLSDWLGVCVSFERVINVVKGSSFSKAMSRRLVKYVCSGLFVFIAASFIHQPLNVNLITDPRSSTVWCVKSIHSSWLQKYESIVYLIHLIAPFTCNFLAAVFLLVLLTRLKARVKSQVIIKTFRQQLYDHKRLIISPIILVLLGLPRLILSLINACTNQYWLNVLFISAYLISYLPSIGTFVIFILPANSYKNSLRATWRKLCKQC
ncbi:hypothetical protein I4U23_022417 [Adineta vaga]|nr:hypothetical protein I4U23_022417 [Adineta vaga]